MPTFLAGIISTWSQLFRLIGCRYFGNILTIIWLAIFEENWTYSAGLPILVGDGQRGALHVEMFRPQSLAIRSVFSETPCIINHDVTLINLSYCDVSLEINLPVF